MLANQPRRSGRAVKDFLDLRFDQAAFLFHHDDQVETIRPFFQTRRFERIDHGGLVNRQPHPFGGSVVDAEQVESVRDVKPCLSCRHDADLRARGAPDPLVEAVRPGVGVGGLALVALHSHFLRNAIIDETD